MWKLFVWWPHTYNLGSLMGVILQCMVSPSHTTHFKISGHISFPYILCTNTVSTFEINIDHLMTKMDLNDSYIFMSYSTVNTPLLLC